MGKSAVYAGAPTSKCRAAGLGCAALLILAVSFPKWVWGIDPCQRPVILKHLKQQGYPKIQALHILENTTPELVRSMLSHPESFIGFYATKGLFNPRMATSLDELTNAPTAARYFGRLGQYDHITAIRVPRKDVKPRFACGDTMLPEQAWGYRGQLPITEHPRLSTGLDAFEEILAKEGHSILELADPDTGLPVLYFHPSVEADINERLWLAMSKRADTLESNLHLPAAPAQLRVLNYLPMDAAVWEIFRRENKELADSAEEAVTNCANKVITPVANLFTPGETCNPYTGFVGLIIRDLNTISSTKGTWSNWLRSGIARRLEVLNEYRQDFGAHCADLLGVARPVDRFYRHPCL